ncbi:MAG: hypothetical protein HWN51_05495 [Desulfobacterales bacterium]|nr:hypothetical protein [Desulfobacterales bacterium]
MAAEISPNVKSSKTGKLVFLAACCIVLVGVGLWLVLRQAEQTVKQPEAPFSPESKRMPIPSEKVIDYGKLKENSDKALTALMEERKAPYGVEKSLDMIVKPDESIKVGEETVRMKKILDEVQLKKGEILERDLVTGAKAEVSGEFGIHVVQKRENIWAIHFRLLKDYYDRKGIELSPLADEPDRLGYSSGVGKILKFSEYMVHIYNLKERRLETDLSLIYPLSKIVIYNMEYIFGLLDRIDYKHVNRIEFDGETLWLPAVQ